MKTITVKETFQNDYISRAAGEKLRTYIVQAFENLEILKIDFLDIVVASITFFDEGIAKLKDENINQEQLIRALQLKNINPYDLDVLVKVAQYRGYNVKAEDFNSSIKD